MEEKIRQIYKIAKFQFESYEEYQAGKRDVMKISRLGIKKRMNYAEVSMLAKVIETEEIVFESKVGKAFLDSLHHRLHVYHKMIVTRLLATLCYGIIAGCITFFLVAGIMEYRSWKAMNDLRQKVQAEETEALKLRDEAKVLQELAEEVTDGAIEDSFPEASNSSGYFWKEPVDIQNILPQYVEIYEKNNYFAGWLQIVNTGIDYPVMHGPDNDYYLSHNIEGQYDKNGLLILDTRCRIAEGTQQYLIYGHNVQSGRMFGELLNYKDKAYWQYHPTIKFDTLMQEEEYAIVSVFLVSLDKTDKLAKFYQHEVFSEQNEFEEYVELVTENSLYDTGVIPVYGEPLLTLVTCDDSVENGRFVVVAGKEKK